MICRSVSPGCFVVASRRIWPICNGITVRGRLFLQRDLVVFRMLIRKNPHWGRTKLSQHICEILDWTQPDGRLKERACRVALLKLEHLGFLKLPKRILERGGKPPSVDFKSDIRVALTSLSMMPDAIDLHLVETRDDCRLWNALVAKYHYLGLPTPVGRVVRYLIRASDIVLGAISFGESAWQVAARDRLLLRCGIPLDSVRNVVVANNRFLILPKIAIPNLASRILGLSLRRLTVDWPMRFATTPLYVETFVDPERFAGTCYRAANWLHVGNTKGFSKRGSNHRENSGSKMLFLRGLSKDVHRQLRIAASGTPPDEGSVAA